MEHPYLPTSLELPGFHPALMSMEFLLGCYGGASALVVLVVWLASGYEAKLRTVDKLLMCWFAISGLTHIVLEGYFVFTPDFFTFTKPHLLAEVCHVVNPNRPHGGYPGPQCGKQPRKEYSKADSRYVGRDPTVVVLEGISAVFAGPFCLLSVYAIAAKATYEHSTQLVVSIVQLYFVTVYSLTVVLKGVEICVNRPLYFWFYLVFLNGIWIVVPFLIACRSWSAINAAFASPKKKTA